MKRIVLTKVMSDINNWTGERLETFIHSETTIEHLHRYAIAMELTKGKKVLDIACGEGYGTNLLSQNALQVTGADIDLLTINKAKVKYKKQNVEFIAGSVTSIPFNDNEFDAVVSFETIEHLTDHQGMMKEIKRVLKPEGLLIISTPDKKNYSDKTNYQNPFHLKELYRDEFQSLLKKYFTNIILFDQQVVTSSLITNTTIKFWEAFSGDFQTINKGISNEPQYFFALASDADFPELHNSFFQGSSILEKALLEREKLIRNTASYRLGHLLLLPAKWIKKKFL